jgi:hypothetical protein
MAKLLLAALTVATVMAGAGRSEDAGAPAEEKAGRVTLALQKTREVASRLRGRVLGSLVRNGMTDEQVTEILGIPGGIFVSGCSATSCYFDLGVNVHTRWQRDAENEDNFFVSGVSFCPLFE